MNGKAVVIATVLVLASSAIASPGEKGLSQADIDKLCEIYSKLPLTNTITIDHARQPKIRPIVVHRCQKVTFKVDRGAASISITDTAIRRANEDSLMPEVGGVVRDTMVLWITVEGEGATIEIPKDYPNPGKTVVVRYHTECYDPTAEEPYECQGTSPPRIIIPPR